MRRWLRLDRNDILVMAVNYPALFIANYLILGERYFHVRAVFWPATLVSTIFYFLFAWMLDVWMKYMRHRYNELNQVARRIVYSMSFFVVMTALYVCFMFWLYGKMNIPGYQFNLTVFRWSLLIGFSCNIIAVGIHEAIYSYNKWKESLQREYVLKELHMQRQLDVLKQQVNPHFLFNSLNSLISLIGENPERAEAFAEELSSVYRYVLRANDQNLTDLKTELEFIRSYYHLLKTRHGQGLNLVVSVDDRFSQYRLPPLTLQLLVENAVKHNIILPEQPLTIEIDTDDEGNLFVRNNLQQKRMHVLSNGVGLTNILAKYEILGHPVPTVQEAEGQFIVALPLISRLQETPSELPIGSISGTTTRNVSVVSSMRRPG